MKRREKRRLQELKNVSVGQFKLPYIRGYRVESTLKITSYSIHYTKLYVLAQGQLEEISRMRWDLGLVIRWRRGRTVEVGG